MLNRYFGIGAAGSSVRAEVIAGLTTFLTMAYIIFVNPQILSTTGMDQGAVFVATCLAAAFGTLIMGLVARFPIALAPGMGLNAFFAFAVVQGMGLGWQAALAAVFISGCIFFVLSVLPVREWLVNALPKSQKMAIAAGIGFFLAFIGLRQAGIVIDHPATLVTVGDLMQWHIGLAVLGFFLIAALDYRRVPGAILLGILAVTVIGIVFAVEFPLGDRTVPTAFQGVVGPIPDPSPTLFALSFDDLFAVAYTSVLIVIFSFLLVDFFDTAGTLIALAHQARMLDEDGKLPRLGRALLADSGATIFGALAGTSTTTSYIESASGIRAGGRTGLTAVVVAVCFLLALFLSPLAGSVPPYATAPAIIFVACMMGRGLADIDWDDASEYAPAVITAIAMPLTFSIATGIGLGLICYAGIKLLAGRPGEVNPAVVLIAALFLLHFAVA